MIAGLGVYIRNECIALCNGIVDMSIVNVPYIAPWEFAFSLDQVLSQS